MMSGGLKMPSEELAARLLSEVEYDERLTGVNMNCLHGPSEVDLYSFATAGRFLYMDDLEMLHDPTSGASLGYVDPKALVRWLEGTLGDHELAEAIDGAVAGLGSYLEMVTPMRQLMAQRLAQCEAVASPSTDD